MLLLVDGASCVEGVAGAAGVGKRGGIDGGEDGEGRVGLFHHQGAGTVERAVDTAAGGAARKQQ